MFIVDWNQVIFPSSWSPAQWSATAITFFIVAWYLLTTIRSYRRLSHFPGPHSVHFSKWGMICATAAGNMPFWLADVSRRYGGLARIGPNDLVTDDAEILRTVNALRSPFIRSEWYNATAFSHDLNHTFCERDEKRHAERRTKLIPGYSGREVEGLESCIDARIEDFCALIERKYLSDESSFRPVDLCRICSYLTLEVIHTLAFGDAIGFLENDRDMHGYLANQESMLPMFEWLSTLPALERFLRIPWISRNVMPKKTDTTGVGLLLKFAERAISERRANKHMDVLGSFLEHGLSDQEAEQEAVLQIIAGSDTTSTTIRMTLFYIMTNPVVYQRIVNELNEAEKRGKLSSPCKDAEVYSMRFLGATIREGLRMWSPVVGLMSKVVPTEGVELAGKFVPGGTCIGYSAWALQRKEKIFGADANIFRPERWLIDGQEAGSLAQMDMAVDLVFGYGKNACLGKPIALIEIRKTIAELLRRYDLSIVKPERPFSSVNRNGLFIQKDMFVRFEKRKKS